MSSNSQLCSFCFQGNIKYADKLFLYDSQS